MGKRTVKAHYMHEYEEVKIPKFMPQAEGTESFFYGEIEEEKIAELEKLGVIVEVLDEEPIAETPGMQMQKIGQRMSRDYPKKFLFSKGISFPKPKIDEQKPNYYIINLKGPLLKNRKDKFEKNDIKLLESFPVDNYTAKLSPEQTRLVQKMPFVRSLRLYDKEDTNSVFSEIVKPPTGPGFQFKGTFGTPPKKNMITLDLRLHNDDDISVVVNWLEENKITVITHGRKKIRVHILENSPLIGKLNSLPEVVNSEEYVKPELYNNIARQIIGIDKINNQIIKQQGEGQIIGIADTGIDDTHPDFQGRIVETIARGRPNDASDPVGHGTHVAGSALGNGAASNGMIRGVAPKASLVFQSLMGEKEELEGLPSDYTELFEEAYLKGVRIHNNSWGANVQSRYTMGSMEVDEFVNDQKDMLIVISAGNAGTAGVTDTTPSGYTEWISIGAPASSKNALTVGASRSSRTKGGRSQLTWKDLSSEKYSEEPIASEKISGNSQSLAAFSSRGPCEETRIKPDLVAPGTDIVSTRSALAPLVRFWGAYPGNDKYGFMGGTSMSCPIVTGCATLVREYFVKERNHEPSAALLKATLINSTKQLTGEDASYDNKDPNYEQGFGMVYMPYAIPNKNEKFNLIFFDDWKNTENHFSYTGQHHRHTINVVGGNFLRICLVWTDSPGNGIQNNLDFVLQNLETKKKEIPNFNRPRKLHIFDKSNNVKVVRIENPEKGDYLIQIHADNILHSGQDYALVITGDIILK